MTQLISRINENTSVPLKIVVPVIVAVIGATWAISVQISGLRAEMSAIAGQVRTVNAKIDGAWTIQNMELWTAKMQRNNPTLRIPEVKEGFPFDRSSVAP